MNKAIQLRTFFLRLTITLAISVAAAALVTPAFSASATQAGFSSERLSVQVLGQGPDVIFVPGYTSSREVWQPAAEQLSGRYRVHLVQFAGFAGETWSHGDAAFIEPALAELGRYAATLDRPAYVGHSMGGLFGLMLAQRQPELLDRVMSVDSLPFYGALMGPNATVEAIAPMAQHLKGMLLAMPDEAAQAQFAMTATGMTLNEARRADIVRHSSTSDRQASATALAELMVTDARGDLGKVKVPFWAIYAVDNSATPAGQAQAIWTREYASLPGVRLEAVENSRHFIMYDQPERLNALLEAFLSDAFKNGAD